MAFVTILIMGTLFSASGILFPEVVCGLFVKLNPQLEKIAGYAIRRYFIAFLPMGINLLSSYYFQAVLRVKESLCISLLRNIILSGVAIIGFPLVFGANSLWLVMPVVECLVLCLSIYSLKK